ncbi:hemolysin family protein [Mesorhizobium marinum]|uniref:Hemolysin family protein n=1 Tax=Mesorhizobium marinum TaxID=3228790 RepID=A0ABV3QZ50_9HYPH
MNDSPETAAQPESGGANAEKAEEGPSSSPDEPSPAAAAQPARTSLLDRLAGLFRHKNGSNLREEIADALAETEHGAEAFSPGERAMLHNILRLREVRVEDVMIPRADIEAVEINTTLGELMKVFERSGHSRMPVYAETLDDPRGMVHIRDLLAHITRLAGAAKKGRGAQKADAQALDFAKIDMGKTIGELNLMRTVLFVPPSMLATDLMARMQASRTQMALVIDEYGGTDGLASLEDIVEMVVGDIEDEHDDEEPLITQTGDGVYIVDGKAEIDDVAALIGDDFKAGEHGDYVDTVGGMVFNTLGRVPVRGEVVQPVPGFEFHVLDADPRRVKRVRIVDIVKAERRRRAARVEQPGS